MLKHDLIPYWYELYKLNKKLGHRNDIFRNVEDSFVLKYGDFSKEDLVLDIGSGESTVPVFIRTKYGSTVHVTDLEVEEMLFLSTPETGFVHEIAKKAGNIFDIYYKGNYHITNDNLSIGLSLGWIELTEEPKLSFGALISMIKK